MFQNATKCEFVSKQTFEDATCAHRVVNTNLKKQELDEKDDSRDHEA